MRHHRGQRRLNRHKSCLHHCLHNVYTTISTALLGHPHQQRRARPLDRHHEEAEILPVPPRRVGAVRHHRGQRRLNRHKRGHHSRRLRSLERAKTCRTWTPANEGGKPWRVHPERGLAVRATASQGRRPRRAKATQCRCSCRRSYFLSDKLKSRPKVRQKIPINQGRSGHWDSKDGTEKMRRLGACDRLRASGFFRRAPPIPTL